jgi:hypothetical protein
LDFKLRGELFVRSSKDQFYKRIPIQWKEMRVLDSIYADILDSNMIYLVKVIKTVGYPGEHLIGIVDFSFDNLTQSHKYNLVMESIANIFFFHHDYGFQHVRNEMYQAIVNGDIHPREYALIYEWSYAQLLGQRMTAKHIFYPFRFKPNEKLVAKKEFYNYYLDHFSYHKDESKVNSHRWLIGMCSLDHDRKKKEFSKKYGMRLEFGFKVTLEYEDGPCPD